MKPISSFSSSSYHNGSNERISTGCCISRILRRILCFSSLPLCNFDHFKEDEKDSSVVIVASGNPGIVAKLMGLESVPRIEVDDSLKKSRSRCRRIIPAYHELEDENFFILSFEQTGGGHASQRRKSSQIMEQSGVNMVLEGNLDSGISGNDIQVEKLKNSGQKYGNLKKKKGKGDKSLAAAMNFETEGDSENSSPNSVLEFVGFQADQESASSPGNISRLANSKMRRPLTDELENCGDYKLIKNEENLRDKNYAEKWDEMRKLAAIEIMKTSWVQNEISKKYQQHNLMEEIGIDLASKVLDQLLDELLINLGQF